MRAATAGTAGRCAGHRSAESEHRSRRIFLGAGLALFATSAAVTILRCTSLPAMEGMPMPDGGTMSMAWMRMPGQRWPAAAASFLGMWLPMMVAMMLPSVLPALWRYHQALLRADVPRPGRLPLLAGLAYLAVWMLIGLAVYPLGASLVAIGMRWPLPPRAVPLATGAIVLAAGMLQFTAWKARLLACCRAMPDHRMPASGGATAALRHGLRLGLHCSGCCAGATAALLAIGAMDLRAMALVTAAITAERLAPAGMAVMRAIGVAAIVAGVILMARA